MFCSLLLFISSSILSRFKILFATIAISRSNFPLNFRTALINGFWISLSMIFFSSSGEGLFSFIKRW